MGFQIDTNPFANQHTFADYDRMNQAFLQQQQAARIEAATKQNILKAQVIGGAAGSGNPQAIMAAKQQLGGMGIDVADVPDDLEGAIGYANAAINAQKPYALGNAVAKAVGVNAAGAAALGSLPDAQAAGLTVPVPTGAIRMPNVTQNQPTIPTRNATPQLQAGITTPEPQVAPSSNPGASMLADMNGGVLPTNIPLNDLTQTGELRTPIDPRKQMQLPTNLPAMPAKEPLETPANFKARLDAWQNSPEVKAHAAKLEAGATMQGKDAATAEAEAIKARELSNRLQPNFDALLKVNKDVPDNRYGVPSEVKAWLSSANPYGDGKWAEASAVWKTINEQQTLTALGQLVASGQIRSNREITRMINNGHFVPADLPEDARATLVKAMAAEAGNIATSQENVAAKMNGGSSQPYAPIPTNNGTTTTKDYKHLWGG